MVFEERTGAAQEAVPAANSSVAAVLAETEHSRAGFDAAERAWEALTTCGVFPRRKNGDGEQFILLKETSGTLHYVRLEVRAAAESGHLGAASRFPEDISSVPTTATCSPAQAGAHTLEGAAEPFPLDAAAGGPEYASGSPLGNCDDGGSAQFGSATEGALSPADGASAFSAAGPASPAGASASASPPAHTCEDESVILQRLASYQSRSTSTVPEASPRVRGSRPVETEETPLAPALQPVPPIQMARLAAQGCRRAAIAAGGGPDAGSCGASDSPALSAGQSLTPRAGQAACEWPAFANFSPFLQVRLVLHTLSGKVATSVDLAECVYFYQTRSCEGRCVYLASPSAGAFQFAVEPARAGHYGVHFWEALFARLGYPYAVHPTKCFQIDPREPALGTGSSGSVLAAVHAASEAPVCVKIVHKDAVYGKLPPEQSDCFHAEVEVLTHVRHPFVVDFYVAFEDNDALYMVLEKLDGGNLWQRVKTRGPLGEDDCCLLAVRLVTALIFLEAQGVLHRDLKPENLVLEDAGDPASAKLIDFGLAAFLGSPRMKMRCGSPGFIAPEVITSGLYTVGVDMFGLGVSLFYALTGRLPFQVPHADAARDPSHKLLLKRNAACDWSNDQLLRVGVSNECIHFLRTLIERDPRRRASALQALEHSWLWRVRNHPRFPHREVHEARTYALQRLHQGPAALVPASRLAERLPLAAFNGKDPCLLNYMGRFPVP